MKYLTILCFVLFGNIAIADEFYTNPTYYFGNEPTIQYFYECSDPNIEIHSFLPDGTEFDGFGGCDGTLQQYDLVLYDDDTAYNGEYTVMVLDTNISCNSVETCDIQYPNAIKFTYKYSTRQNNLWQNDNGFFSGLETSSALASVASGVRSTGSNIWGNIALAGIGIAFIIGLALINFMSESVKTEKVTKGKRKGRKNKKDFIYHGAEDLEFKRNYGSKS